MVYSSYSSVGIEAEAAGIPVTFIDPQEGFLKNQLAEVNENSACQGKVKFYCSKSTFYSCFDFVKKHVFQGPLSIFRYKFTRINIIAFAIFSLDSNFL